MEIKEEAEAVVSIVVADVSVMAPNVSVMEAATAIAMTAADADKLSNTFIKSLE